ncbi:MAG: hypothetical protein Q4C85_08400 [Actinomyces sp.]|uniref:hypothetical protein n=1 Tax=Actinomyces sp. TaxID=29317 RepID=UPI0026DA7340|nr:hypothetical protein [Actinomyces sp.]MDO4243757.1 hypothetical protein [Actinomyces sp.]
MNLRSCALSLPSLLLVGALALAGCGSGASSGSGSAPASDRAVFDFASAPDSAPGGEVTVQLPDGLVEALKIDGVTVPVKSVTLRSQEVTSTSLCAVEGHVEFNEGGEAVVTKPVPPKTNINEKTGEVIPEEGDRSIMGSANWAARYYGVATDAPYGSEILPMSQFDANKPEEGVYMDSPDSFVEVLPCATSVDDLATTRITGFDFQRIDSKSESGSDRFAYVTVGVMRDGTITIPQAGVDGYARDSSGSWVQGN